MIVQCSSNSKASDHHAWMANLSDEYSLEGVSRFENGSYRYVIVRTSPMSIFGCTEAESIFKFWNEAEGILRLNSDRSILFLEISNHFSRSKSDLRFKWNSSLDVFILVYFLVEIWIGSKKCFRILVKYKNEWLICPSKAFFSLEGWVKFILFVNAWYRGYKLMAWLIMTKG